MTKNNFLAEVTFKLTMKLLEQHPFVLFVFLCLTLKRYLSIGYMNELEVPQISSMNFEYGLRGCYLF